MCATGWAQNVTTLPNECGVTNVLYSHAQKILDGAVKRMSNLPHQFAPTLTLVLCPQPHLATMADSSQPHPAGRAGPASTQRDCAPLLANNNQQSAANTAAQRGTETQPQPRKRARPRNTRDPEEDNRSAASKRRRMPILDADRSRIGALHDDGKSNAEIARLLGYEAKSVCTFVRQYKENGCVYPTCANRVKHTLEMKQMVAALFLLDPTMTQQKAAGIAADEFNATVSQSAVDEMLKETRLSLKSLVGRKMPRNTPETFVTRRGYVEFVREMQPTFRLLYIGEQRYNAHMHGRHGRSPAGRKAVAEEPGRSANAGAPLALHLAVCEDVGAVHAMVVTRDADMITTRQFLEGLVDACSRLDKSREPGDTRPWLAVLDDADYHRAPHVTDFMEEANLSYCFLPPHSPFLNPVRGCACLATSAGLSSRRAAVCCRLLLCGCGFTRSSTHSPVFERSMKRCPGFTTQRSPRSAPTPKFCRCRAKCCAVCSVASSQGTFVCGKPDAQSSTAPARRACLSMM